MQVTDEQAQETTYAQQTTASSQHALADDRQPTDRNSQIYSYITLIAERCHDARMAEVNETNNPAPKAA